MNSLSVVTLSRNQGEFLAEAIHSVIQQDISHEYFVYDVGSSDNSRSTILEFAEKLTPIFVDTDLGPSDGLNSAFNRSSGSILYYLNSDDRTVPGAFKFALNYFERNPECDVLHGSVRIINRTGEGVTIKPSMKFSLIGYAFGYSVVYQQATFFRREIFNRTKFNLENRTCWDGELIVDMAMAGAKIHKTAKILGEFRIYSESITGSGRLKNQILKDHQRIAMKILGRPLNIVDLMAGKFLAKIRAVMRLRYSFSGKELENLEI